MLDPLPLSIFLASQEISSVTSPLWRPSLDRWFTMVFAMPEAKLDLLPEQVGVTAYRIQFLVAKTEGREFTLQQIAKVAGFDPHTVYVHTKDMDCLLPEGAARETTYMWLPPTLGLCAGCAYVNVRSDTGCVLYDHFFAAHTAIKKKPIRGSE